jgi:hypothetical protein
VEISRNVLSRATSPREAVDAAERLIGQWPHARPPDAKTYAASLAAVLAGYPLGLVQECCDPRTGLARTREFPPTVAAIVEWCDKRLDHHRTVATWKPSPAQAVRPALPDDPVRAEQIGLMLRGLAHTLKAGIEERRQMLVKKIWPAKPWDGAVTPVLAQQIAERGSDQAGVQP